MPTPVKSKAKLKSNNSTGYNGVVKLSNGKFVGQSWFDKKNNRTEQFTKAVDAAKAYDALVSEALANGKLKRVSLNFPPK
jgi:hypothetical protein